MKIELAKGHFGSVSKNVPAVKVSNFYAVENPLSPDGVSYISRPAVEAVATLPVNETIRGMFYQQGWVDDNLLVVAGDSFYKLDKQNVYTRLATIPGVAACRFTATLFYVAVLSEGVVYLYDGSVLTPVNLPDGQLADDITTLNNYIIITVQNSTKYYWINPGDLTVDDLSFASAEANPDHLESVQTVSDEVWFLGRSTTEVWVPSGNADAPFTRVSGRVFSTGCLAQTSATTALNNGIPCLIWVSDSREVVLGQGSPDKISNDFVEEVLKASSTFLGWYFRRNRNDFYVLTTDVETLVYDLTYKTWYTWSTYLKTTWDASIGVQIEDTVYCSSLQQSPIISQLVDKPKDNTIDWIVSEISGAIGVFTRSNLPCFFLDLFANLGYSVDYSTAPLVELRWSDTQGATWSSYMQASIGARGATDTKVSFRSLGNIQRPGRLFEFRFSGVNNLRLDYVNMNGD